MAIEDVYLFVIGLVILFEIGHLWITRQLIGRVRTLEFWNRRFDEVLDPEGTGDVYIKNQEFRKEQDEHTNCR